MHIRPGTITLIRRSAKLSAAAATLALVAVACAEADAGPNDEPETKPKIVLVHGAFADASSWNGVVSRLQDHGYDVVAPANPLRGLTSDSAYMASYLGQVDRCVLLVGHSYGGAVITNAAYESDNVVGLVYVAAFAPDEGEVLDEVEKTSKDSVLDTALEELNYPAEVEGGTATEFAIDPAKFHDVFAADLSADEARLLSATQRPVAEAGFTDVSGPAAWKRLPSWAVVATGDTAAGADIVRSMADRAGAEITEIESSHVVLVSHPADVARVIEEAAAAVVNDC